MLSRRGVVFEGSSAVSKIYLTFTALPSNLSLKTPAFCVSRTFLVPVRNRENGPYQSFDESPALLADLLQVSVDIEDAVLLGKLDVRVDRYVHARATSTIARKKIHI